MIEEQVKAQDGDGVDSGVRNEYMNSMSHSVSTFLKISHFSTLSMFHLRGHGQQC